MKDKQINGQIPFEITRDIQNEGLVLSDEQLLFIRKAQEGSNILVDACIGSGKTTAIQHLCDELPGNLRVLYLTYNKLLKIDAKSKIHKKNVTVNNYHGFAYRVLSGINVVAGTSDLIQKFNRLKPELLPYDVLIIDEYQDIDQELAEMLEHIKSFNPGMQIIAVGDMAQKIYDKTTLDVFAFIERFLGAHITLTFTRCFRLSAGLAAKLGRIWQKEIVGVNENCLVEEMDVGQVVEFLAEQQPRDILCLGARIGALSRTLNTLESKYPEKFNKHTVYASISDEDSTGTPEKDSAIFTTFDSSKGLERRICVVFDYTESYWAVRIDQPQQSYEILRNIFCVAASRGKERIIFVTGREGILPEATLSAAVEMNQKFRNVGISEMFSFKFKENVEECFSLLKVTPMPASDASVIHVKNHDELIDLSPCIGIYQEAAFFDKYNIDRDIELLLQFYPKREAYYFSHVKNSSPEEKVLYLTSLETNQDRYRTQVAIPFIGEDEKARIIERLGTRFRRDENVQVECSLDFSGEEGGKKIFSAVGLADVVKDDAVYELKFVSELTHEHFLQCACYVVALGLEKGVLWNTRNNALYEITVPDKDLFLDAVVKTVTKARYSKYYKPGEIPKEGIGREQKYFAVIDTETNYQNQVMSIGAVVVDSKTFQIVSQKYYVLSPEYRVVGMYSSALPLKGEAFVTHSRKDAISDLLRWFAEYGITAIFAYNARFDCAHLPELSDFVWHDIMKLAMSRQYNSKIPADADCTSTGKLKRGYGVEPILRMLTGNESYLETHNALYDAMDELKIMRLLGHDLEKYEIAVVEPKKKSSEQIRKANTNETYKSGLVLKWNSFPDFQSTRPVVLEFQGNSEVDFTSWNDIYIVLTRLIVRSESERFSRLQTFRNRDRKIVFTKDANVFIQKSRDIGGFELNLDYTLQEEFCNITDLLDYCNIAYGNVIIRYVEKENPPPEKQRTAPLETPSCAPSTAADRESGPAKNTPPSENPRASAPTTNTNSQNDSEVYFSVAEASKIFRVSKSTVYNMIRRGDIPAQTVRGILTIREKDAVDYIKRREEYFRQKQREKQTMMAISIILGIICVLFVILLLNSPEKM